MMNTVRSEGTSRDMGIDLLKAIAIFGVIIIHMCYPGYSTPIGSFEWFSTLFWGCLSRASVPVFFMCSGALLLSPQKELPLKKLLFKNLLKILIALFVWAFAYKVYHLVDTGTFSAAALYQAGKEVLLFEQEYHFYYLQILIIFYLFLPITRIFVKHAEQKDLIYAIALWFLVGIFYPTHRPFWPFHLLTGIPVQWALNQTYAAIGYGVLGYYLIRYPLAQKWNLLLLLAGFLSVFGLTARYSAQTGSLYEHFLEGMSVGVAILAAGEFGFFYNRKGRVRGKGAVAITMVSKSSFCVYLIHVYFMQLLQSWEISASCFPCILSIPVLSLLVFLLSFLCYAVLSRIPVVRKWLV